MTINGQDFERHEVVSTIEQCWVMAAERMKSIDNAHGAPVDKIGVGCVMNRGKDL